MSDITATTSAFVLSFAWQIFFHTFIFNYFMLFPFFFFYNFFKNYYLFIYLFIWLCWVFVSVRGLPLAAASGGHSSSRCVGPLTIVASLVAEHGLQMRRLSSCGSRA